jgi:hypothetical protein
MFDLLVLTSLDQLLFILKILFNFITKQATSTRRSTVLSLPLQLGFPDDLCLAIHCQIGYIGCQFLLPGGSIGPGYVLQLLFGEKSQNCEQLNNH